MLRDGHDSSKDRVGCEKRNETRTKEEDRARDRAEDAHADEGHAEEDHTEDEQGHMSAALSECEDAGNSEKKKGAKKQAPYNTLCFSGGGTNGITFIGALCELFARGEVDWVREDRVVNHFIGTSVGALIATLAYCRIDLFAAETAQLVTDFCSFASQTPTSLLKSGFGLSDGDHCIQFLQRVLKQQFRKDSLTFIELHHIVGGTLTLVASDLKTAAPVYISHETHPHEEVARACFSSMCLPGMFKWQTLNKKVGTEWLPDAVVSRQVSAAQYKKATKLDDFIGERFTLDGSKCEILAYDKQAGTWQVDVYELQHVLDGCFTDNNPFSAAKPGARVLNLVVKKSREFQPDKHGLGRYTMRVLSLSMRRVEKLMEYIYQSVERDCVVIDAKKAGVRSSTRVDKADFVKLIRQGAAAADEFFVQKYGKKARRRQKKTRAKTRKKETNEVQTQTGATSQHTVLRVGKWENDETEEEAEAATDERAEPDGSIELGPEHKTVRMSELNRKWTKMSSSGKAVMRAWTILDPRFDEWREGESKEEGKESEEEEEDLVVDEFIDQFGANQ